MGLRSDNLARQLHITTYLCHHVACLCRQGPFSCASCALNPVPISQQQVSCSTSCNRLLLHSCRRWVAIEAELGGLLQDVLWTYRCYCCGQGDFCLMGALKQESTVNCCVPSQPCGRGIRKRFGSHWPSENLARKSRKLLARGSFIRILEASKLGSRSPGVREGALGVLKWLDFLEARLQQGQGFRARVHGRSILEGFVH